MSNEINNGGTCPFCLKEVHPQAVACNGCGASYKKEASKIQVLVTFLYIILWFILMAVPMFNGAETFVYLVGIPVLAGGLIFMKSRWKYVWVRRQ